MAELELTPQLYAIFSSLVEETCGMYYGPRDRALFASKLITQAAEAGYDTLLDYYYRLRYDDPDGVELRALIQSLVVHETYFFRELTPLQQVVGTLCEIVRTRGRARVWSAACSTGEEPLTLAMLLAERGVLDRVEIIGTDISESAIERARSGQHGRRALRDGHPAQVAQRYLTVTERGMTIAPEIHAAVRFQTLNLLDDEGTRQLGKFDVVLCRNVLIYFGEPEIPRVIQRLARSLLSDGLLIVGVSESLLRFGTSLTCEERGGAFVYRSPS